MILAAILVGAVFGLFAARKGLHFVWPTFLNICVAVYLAVFLSPTVIQNIGEYGRRFWAAPVCMLVLGLICFGLLQSVAVAFFSGRYTFPKTVDVLGSAVLGFLAGFMVTGFAGVLILSIPDSRESYFADQLEGLTEASVIRACNCIDCATFQKRQYNAEHILVWLLADEELFLPESGVGREVKFAEPDTERSDCGQADRTRPSSSPY